MARKIIFKHGRAPGDVLMLTAGIRDFKALFPDIQINVDTKFNDLFENNPYIDSTIKRDQPDVEYYPVGYPAIQGCNDGIIHFTFSFLQDMIAQVDAYERLPLSIGEFCAAFSGGGDRELSEGDQAKEPFIAWRKKYARFTTEVFRQKADLHLTEKEKTTNIIKDVYGIEKYWIVAPGGKRDCTAKVWDWRRFQKVIDYFDGLIKFVVIGRSDHLIERLDNCISYIDKTRNRVRDLVPLFYHAAGVVTGVSLPMHLAAAMPSKIKREQKPCVAIYGGREPVGFTAYCNHQILHTNGALGCCDSGGCWQSRIIPIAKDMEMNKRMCHNTTTSDGRTIQKCMDSITANDIIRAISKYYEAGYYQFEKPMPAGKPVYQYQISDKKANIQIKGKEIQKEINVLASLQSAGGGEQSAAKIVDMFRAAGWKVNFYAWDRVHANYQKNGVEKSSFKSGMLENMKAGLPLLFYGNDQINDFCRNIVAIDVVEKSAGLIIGINFINGALPKCEWLARSGQMKGIIFQNQEKLGEFRRDAIGFEATKLISLFGAIDLDRFYELPQAIRGPKEQLIILKHCTPDYRKYTTKESAGNGQKIHLWQREIHKETDIKFYGRLLDDLPFDVRFEYMEAHPELVEHFKENPHMVFHPWDSMNVGEFLKRGHIYLYRTSNLWRDQYPRVVAEALAAGLPVLSEPRDGTKDRIEFGNTGFYCVDYDQFLDSIKKLYRKEKYRLNMGRNAKDWAKANLDPRKWVDVIKEML